MKNQMLSNYSKSSNRSPTIVTIKCADQGRSYRHSRAFSIVANIYMTNIDYYEELNNLKAVLTSIGVQLDFQPLQEHTKEIVCPDNKFEKWDPSKILLVKFGAEDIFFSSLLIQN